VSAGRAEQLARRQALLELEADLQRATLAASLAQWEQKPLMSWLNVTGRIALRAWSAPRLRWLLLAALWRRLSRGLARRRERKARSAA
jgi:hypothetical protein